MDFAAFVRAIERRLIGYFRFATLSARHSEELFAQACAELRDRWPSLAPEQRENALFEIARAAVELFNTERQEPTDAQDELSRELSAMGFNSREALCAATFGPAARVSALGARMLNAAPAPSVSRQLRATRTTLKSLLLVAFSLCLCLAPVAGFAALQSTNAASPAQNKPPEDWLGDQIAQLTRGESETTFYKGALASASSGEDARLDIAPGFDLLVPAKLPEGFKLESVEQVDGKSSGLDFTVVRLIYANAGARLTLFEAEGGFPWLSEFNLKAARNAKSVQRHGTAVLVVSDAFSEDALEEIAASLKPR